MSGLASIEDAIEALSDGRPVLVLDDEDRENEGDVVLAAQHASTEWVAWTVRYSSGLLCAPLPDALADRLELPPMVDRNEDARGTAYTVSIDAREGVSTGISASDRARTVRVLADPASTPRDLIRPGHILPLRARDGGVLERPGHTEAAVDLCRLAGLEPVGLIAELVHDDGSMMRMPSVVALGREHGLPVVTIADLVRWRRRVGDSSGLRLAAHPERRVERVATTTLPTRHGSFVAHGFRDLRTGAEHVALVGGGQTSPTLVRVHSECLTGDAFGSQRCDCGPQLDAALERVGRDGGVVVYVGGHEGRGVGLLSKLQAYALQDAGHDTVEANLALGLPADAREYGAAAAVLADLGVRRVRLLTNNPAKVTGLRAHGVDVVERIPLLIDPTDHSSDYLRTKSERMGHHIPVDDEAGLHEEQPA